MQELVLPRAAHAPADAQRVGDDPSLPLPLFEEIHGKAAVAFRRNRTLGIRNGIAFEAAHSTAHTQKGAAVAKSFSIVEARQNFTCLIQTAERGRIVEITRRGEPIAVVLSAAQYLALVGEGPSFKAAIDAIRARLRVDQLGISDEDFAGLRDQASGREVWL